MHKNPPLFFLFMYVFYVFASNKGKLYAFQEKVYKDDGDAKGYIQNELVDAWVYAAVFNQIHNFPCTKTSGKINNRLIT